MVLMARVLRVVSVLRASSSGDVTALESLLRFTTTGCTLQLGEGGPPKCWMVPGAEQVEGTLVDVFPTSVCSAEYEPSGVNITRLLSKLVAPEGEPGSVTGVYAVHELSDAGRGEPYWPEGDYAVVFLLRQGDESWGTRVRIGDGGIVRIDFGCGRQPPDAMIVGGALDLLAAPAGRLLGVGPGLSVSDALASDLTGPLLVNGFIVIRDGETRLCELLLESFPAQCGDASMVVEGFDPSTADGLTEASGVIWSAGPMQLLGAIDGDHLVVEARSLG